jgi:hypothetical protein
MQTLLLKAQLFGSIKPAHEAAWPTIALKYIYRILATVYEKGRPQNYAKDSARKACVGQYYPWNAHDRTSKALHIFNRQGRRVWNHRLRAIFVHLQANKSVGAGLLSLAVLLLRIMIMLRSAQSQWQRKPKLTLRQSPMVTIIPVLSHSPIVRRKILHYFWSLHYFWRG